MKVLILSCNTGEGHNSCAAALEEECRNQNIPCDTEDALRFISPEVSRFISNWHVRIYRHAPGLFRVGYRAAEDHPAQFHEGSALYRYLTQGAEKLCGFIAGSGYDTVICTHTFAALMVSEVVKTHLPNLKTCFIATDYTCSPSVKDSSLDRYFIPASSLSGDFLGGGVTSERLRACGIPVRQMFRSSVRKEDAKRAFGIPANHKHLVMMCGSMGCGPMHGLTLKLAKELNLDLKSIDMFEINEAFASQAFAVRRDLGLDPEKTNIYGGGISIGHPIGATGCILTVKVMYELMRTDKKDAMISMCIGGGQGISMYFTKC